MSNLSLFDLGPDPIHRSAVIDRTGRYRYALSRKWDGEGRAVFLMLNPSTADAETDDPTIRRCLGFARSWGCGILTVINLFALRATDPAELSKAEDPIGPENDAWIDVVAALARSEGRPIVCAWGNHGSRSDRADQVVRRLRGLGCQLAHLGLTSLGQPKHPLYLRSDVHPIPWEAADG